MVSELLLVVDRQNLAINDCWEHFVGAVLLTVQAATGSLVEACGSYIGMRHKQRSLLDMCWQLVRVSL